MSLCDLFSVKTMKVRLRQGPIRAWPQIPEVSKENLCVFLCLEGLHVCFLPREGVAGIWIVKHYETICPNTH